MSTSVRFLDTDGSTEILAPTDAGGYRLRSLVMPERRFRRSVVVADDVEGSVEQQSVLDSAIYEIEWQVRGSSGSQVESRRQSLLAAAERRLYLLEVTVDGVASTWTANRADSVTSLDPNYLLAKIRPVILRIPVQPRTVEELA